MRLKWYLLREIVDHEIELTMLSMIGLLKNKLAHTWPFPSESSVLQTQQKRMHPLQLLTAECLDFAQGYSSNP